MVDFENISFTKNLVSVIVPVYNSEEYIAETLDSILASDYPNFEIICVNDGSKDNSLDILNNYENKDKRVKVYSQQNKGVCLARNFALLKSKGEFILPVDADNLISDSFITVAVNLIKAHPDIKAVIPKAMFFGERIGEWRPPEFSLKLLARKNIIDTCALFRKKDCLKFGGYCERMISREDWDFWISMLKDGGRVVKTIDVSLYYRVRKGSKRITDRKNKKEIIDILNERHYEFFYRELGGPLRYHRSWSKFLNKFASMFISREIIINSEYSYLKSFIYFLPNLWNNGEGSIMFSRRNEIRLFNYDKLKLVVKSFAKPNILNSFIYGIFRKSKAKRSYEYSVRLNKLGIDTPIPIAFYNKRICFIFRDSYFISEKSKCKYTFYDVINDINLENRLIYLKLVGQMTAKLHNNNIYPLDYSGGNILLDVIDGQPRYELVDLNRMYFGKIDIDRGCKGFERLNVEPEDLNIMAIEYAKGRNFDENKCIELINKYRWTKHQK